MSGTSFKHIPFNAPGSGLFPGQPNVASRTSYGQSGGVVPAPKRPARHVSMDRSDTKGLTEPDLSGVRQVDPMAHNEYPGTAGINHGVMVGYSQAPKANTVILTIEQRRGDMESSLSYTQSNEMRTRLLPYSAFDLGTYDPSSPLSAAEQQKQVSTSSNQNFLRSMGIHARQIPVMTATQPQGGMSRLHEDPIAMCASKKIETVVINGADSKFERSIQGTSPRAQDLQRCIKFRGIAITNRPGTLTSQKGGVVTTRNGNHYVTARQSLIQSVNGSFGRGWHFGGSNIYHYQIYIDTVERKPFLLMVRLGRLMRPFYDENSILEGDVGRHVNKQPKVHLQFKCRAET